MQGFVCLFSTEGRIQGLEYPRQALYPELCPQPEPSILNKLSRKSSCPNRIIVRIMLAPFLFSKVLACLANTGTPYPEPPQRSQLRWHVSVIPASVRQRQTDAWDPQGERSCLKKKKKKMWTASEDRHPVIHLEEKWLWRAGEMAMECWLLAS